jgi:hypothetical protein
MEMQAEPSFMRGRRPHPGGERRAPRRWMTGSLAMVMASVCSVGASATPERRSQVRHSPYGVAETARRLEAAAHATGLHVLANVAPPVPSPMPHRIVVLASSEGGTPVLLDRPGAWPDMPMALHVEAAAGGGALVRLTEVDLDGRDDEGDWPSTVTGELADLPRLVDQALR